ncbi:MAG: hypothetical protein E6R03_10765 [Hyphomicrobiaceae bacterium]|nr:MAG: hypothetical protein E6R03_10765 [Hyphomicrobiaceae bacterium]
MADLFSLLPTTRNQSPYMLSANQFANDPEITVTGQQQQESAPANMLPIPLEGIRGKTATPDQIKAGKPLEGLPAHKGLFGVKGTLRNVIGMLGDALLTGSGMKPIYAPIRQRENLSDAMTAYASNPLEAINRVMAVDPEYGRQLYNDWQTQNAKFDQIEAIKADHAQTGLNRRAQLIEKFAIRLGQMLNGAKTPEQRNAAIQLAGRQAAVMNLSLEDLGITDGDLTPDEAQAFVAGATSVNQQNTLPLREQQVEIQQQNADANTLRASRASQPRSAPNPTNASLAGPLLAKVQRGEPLTAGQQEYLDRLGYSKGKGRRGSGRQSAPSSTGKLIFRNGKLVPQ